MRTLRFVTAALLLCAGCGNNPYFNDDEGAPQPSVPLVGSHPDHLSLPYAAGAQVGMSVPDSQSTWQLESDAPTVLAIGKLTFSDGTLNATCTAGVPGQARLALVDSTGAVLHSATITVAAPDSAKIIDHGEARLLGSPDADPTAAEITSARVLTGGTAVVAVAYFSGAERLFGRGIAQTVAPTGIAVQNQTASGLAVNEFLFLDAGTSGTYSLPVSAGGTLLVTLPVTAVPSTAIAAITLEEQVGGSRNDGDQVWVLGRTRDAQGNAILGGYSTWTLDGAPQLQSDMKTTLGDLYRYNVSSSTPPEPLVATHDTITATRSIPATSGKVYDTTYLGCTLSPHPSNTPTPLLILLACIALTLRPRKSPKTPS